MNVFISSVIRGLEDLRAAAREAIELLGHHVIEAEQMPASPASPQSSCLQEARNADVVVLLMCAPYGAVQSSGLSATHEEYRAVHDSDKVLVFIQDGVQCESKQADFLAEVRSWEEGHFTNGFRTAEELKTGVVRALRAFEVGRATGVVDEAQLVARAEVELKEHVGSSDNSLVLIVTVGPPGALLRPSQLRAEDLGRRVAQEVLFGEDPMFELAGSENPRVQQGRLVLGHKHGAVTLNCAGTVAIRVSAEPTKPKSVLRPLVEEDIQQKLRAGLRVAGRLLNMVDSSQRASAVVPQATITNPSSWVTQDEYAANPDRMYVKRLLDWKAVTVRLTPAGQRRPALLADSDRLAEDLTVLLRTKIQ